MNAAKKLTLAELIAAHAAELTPSVGDKAYTYYRGRKYVGVITSFDPDRGTGIIEPSDPAEDWGWHKGARFWHGDDKNRTVRGLFFGYEEKSIYNVTEGCWHVIADAD